MKKGKQSLLLFLALFSALILLLPLAAIAQNEGASEPDSAETLQEQAMALAAEQEDAAPAFSPNTLLPLQNVDYPLFVGVDDTTVPAYQIDPATSNAIQAFIGAQVWGAAFDEVNNIVYFNSGSTLYEWPVGGVINLLGTIVDGGGATQSMVGLAFYDGQLYATKNIANEAIWAIDTNTLVATVHIDYVDGDLDCGGFAADPNTGTFYCANDDATPHGAGLVIVNPDASVTFVAPYPAGQTDIDGLAISDDGFAYLVIDEPGFIYVYDLIGGAYTTPITNPWTTSEVFSAGTWIWEPQQGGQCPAGPEVGELTVDDPTFNRPVGFGGSCSPSGVGTNVYYDVYSYDMSGPAPHDLFASLVGGTTMDTVMVFYQAPDGSANPFDPTQPCLNSVAYNDDFGGTLQSQINATDLGTGWVDVVVTTFGNDTTGAYTMDVSSQSCQAPSTDARLAVAHLAPFAMDPGTAVTITLNATPVLTNFAYGDSTAYLTVAPGSYDVEVYPAGSPTPAMSGTFTLTAGVDYSVIATGDGVNHSLELLALIDDNSAPAAGNFKLRLGHLAPFAAGPATADIRLQDGTPVLTDVNFSDVAPYLELPAGTYDLKITTPGGATTLIDPMPVTLPAGAIVSAFATGEGSNQPLGAFAWPSDDIGFFLPLAPVIEVTPADISVTQLVTTVVSYPLTISNLGAGDLDWNIAEEAAQAVNSPSVTVQARQVAELGDGNGTAREEANTASSSSGVGAPANTPIFAPTGSVLYDNGPLVNSPGTGVGGADESVLQTVSLGMTTLGFGHQVINGNRMADDFTIPPGSIWSIDEIVFYAYQTGSPITSTIDSLNLRIWDGEPGNGGTVIWGDTSTNVLSSTSWSGIYRVTETTTGGATDRPIMASTANLGGLSLPAGTYWLDWQSGGTLGSGPWAPPITVNGQATTGNGLQSLADNGVTWAAANDTGTGTQQGLPFLIMGSLSCSSDIPWVSVDPITGTLPSGSSVQVDVTFDTSGLTAGTTYTGTLCILSNDPVMPLVTVPLSMTVAEPTWLQVAHLAPFAEDASVTVALNGTSALTDFNYGDSTGYIELPAGMYDVEIFPTGSATPAITATVELMADTYYSAIATGDGVNQPLALVALVDDNSAPTAGTFKLRLGHLAPFAAGDALADIRLQDGTPVLTDVAYADITGYIELPAGTYDLKVTTPGGGTTLIDPLPVTFADGDIITAFATGEGSNQALGVFAWPPDTMGFFLPLFEGYTLYLPLVLQP